MSRDFALICPVGETGQIVTMTINKFLDKWRNHSKIQECTDGKSEISEYAEVLVIVPYTKIAVDENIISGPDESYEDGDLSEYWETPDPEDEQWKHKIYSATDYNWCYGLEGEEGTPQAVIKNLRLVLLPVQQKGSADKPIGDIDNESATEQFQDLAYGLTKVLTELDYRVHISLTGGRKTMVGYQMSSAVLFGPEDGVSQVLDPSEKEAQAYMEQKNIRGYSFAREFINEAVIHAYQPFDNLYDEVPVKYIDLSRIVEPLSRQMRFADDIEQIIDPIRSKSILEILRNSDSRKKIYEIGEIYRENLGSKQITEEVSQKYERGLLSGLFLSFLGHEGLDKLLVHYPISEPAYLARNGITVIRRLLENADKIIREKDAKLHLEVKKVRLRTILLDARKLAVADRIDLQGFDQIDRKIAIEADQWILALAFRNIIRNALEAMTGERMQRLYPDVPKWLKVEATEFEDSSSVTVEFTDNGPGINMGKLGGEYTELFKIGRTTKLEPIFEIDFDEHISSALENGEVPVDCLEKLERNEIFFQEPNVSVEIPGCQWMVITRNKKYILEKKGKRLKVCQHAQNSGLGLFVVRRIIESHGGKIDAQNRLAPDHGAIFTISLPLKSEYVR